MKKNVININILGSIEIIPVTDVRCNDTESYHDAINSFINQNGATYIFADIDDAELIRLSDEIGAAEVGDREEAIYNILFDEFTILFDED